MSRSFNMFVRITGVEPERAEAVQEAADDEWSFGNDWYEMNGVLTSCGDGQLGGGESDDVFADRLAKAIWDANGSFCRVVVRSTYLDDLPCEAFSLEQSDYDRLMVPS